MSDVAEIDLSAIPGRVRRLWLYTSIFVLVAAGWWFFLPQFKAGAGWGIAESVAIWAPVAAVAIAVVLELTHATRSKAFSIAQNLIGLCLLASFTHFVLAALQFGEVQSITKCCGYSRVISVSQDPLGYWMYVALLCLFALGAAIWVAVKYALRRDER